MMWPPLEYYEMRDKIDSAPEWTARTVMDLGEAWDVASAHNTQLATLVDALKEIRLHGGMGNRLKEVIDAALAKVGK